MTFKKQILEEIKVKKTGQHTRLQAVFLILFGLKTGLRIGGLKSLGWNLLGSVSKLYETD